MGELYSRPCFVALEKGRADCDCCRVITRAVEVEGSDESLRLRSVQQVVVLGIATDTDDRCRALNISQIFEQVV